MQTKVETIYNVIRVIIIIVAVLLIALVSVTEQRYRVVYTINHGETAACDIDTVVYLQFNTDLNHESH